MPMTNMLFYRVDIAGYPVLVKGEYAKDILEAFRREYTIMKLALHCISHEASGAGEIALDALAKIKG